MHHAKLSQGRKMHGISVHITIHAAIRHFFLSDVKICHLFHQNRDRRSDYINLRICKGYNSLNPYLLANVLKQAEVGKLEVPSLIPYPSSF